MKYLILGTAGHIDHGKTSLVKALTGTDTDRLPEEKARGITIELGFADIVLDGGIHLGIVDVPGHERFIRTMVAGVGGMDIVMMVIAADEGVMPQTREHLDICQLLGVKQGLVALTKTDLVDPAWLNLVTEEVSEFVTGTFLEGGAIVPVSARRGTGLDTLKEELGKLSAEVSQKRCEGPFRLPVDRVFTVAGFGTVVTGTLLSGQVSVGDEAEIMPAGTPCRIRGIQAHSLKVEKGSAGQRLALNLQGVDHHQLSRGDVVTPRGIYRPTRIVDVRLDHLASSPRQLKHRAALRLHSATYEVPAKIILFGQDALEPGQSAFAQLRLEQPVLLLNGDPFVLRSASPSATIAGGRILDPSPPARRRRTAEALELLSSMAEGDENRSILEMVSAGMLSGLTFSDLLQRTGLSPKRLESVLTPLLASGEVVQVVREPRAYLSRGNFHAICTALASEVAAFHKANPIKEGMGKEELKTKMPDRSDQRFFAPCLTALEKQGVLSIARDMVILSGRDGSQSADTDRVLILIENELKKEGLEPESIKCFSEKLGLSEKTVLENLNLLVRQGKAVKVKSDLFYATDPYRTIEQKAMSHLREMQELTPATFRELTGLSRKYLIPLLEYLDSQKLTIRVGDKRVLRKSDR